MRRFFTIILLSLSFLAGHWTKPALSDQPGAVSPAETRLVAQKTGSRSRATKETSKNGNATEKAEDSWTVIFIGKQRVGYSRESIRRVTENGRTIIRTTSDTHMTLKRFGQTLKMQIIFSSKETQTGDWLSFVFELRNPPANVTRTVGTIREKNDGSGQKQLLLETTIAGKIKKSSQAWNPRIKSPAYQDRMLRKFPLKPGEKRSFSSFDPQFNKPTEIKLSADRLRPTKLFDGSRRELLKVRITQSVLPKVSTYAYLDDKGATLKTETDSLGQSMIITYSVSKEEALKAIEGQELDLAVSSLIRVRRIRNAHKTGKIVYRITVPGEDPSQSLVSDSTQKVRKIDADTAELTVTALALPNGNKRVKTDKKYSQPTRFLQSRDERVREHARRASAGEVNPARIAGRMEQYVQRKLTNKNFSTALASAAEVARNLEGDCTEHAVLLAAMLRAERIPSRIAVGLVYVDRESAFGGHMWTEAWLDGHWIPLDATLGQRGIGAAHIKLAVSSFDDDGPAPVTSFLPLLKVLGNMQIEVIAVE